MVFSDRSFFLMPPLPKEAGSQHWRPHCAASIDGTSALAIFLSTLRAMEASLSKKETLTDLFCNAQEGWFALRTFVNSSIWRWIGQADRETSVLSQPL